jgi:hypothetical protein
MNVVEPGLLPTPAKLLLNLLAPFHPAVPKPEMGLAPLLPPNRRMQTSGTIDVSFHPPAGPLIRKKIHMQD